MRRLRRSIALTLILLGAHALGARALGAQASPAPSTPPAAPAPPTQPTDTAIDELLHKSGLWGQLPQLEVAVQEGLAAAMAKRDAGDTEGAARVRAAVAAAYSGDRLRGSVRRELATALTAAEVGEVVAWLDTDLGVRITALEERAGEPAQQALEKAESAKLLAETPPARVEQVRQLLRALRWGESIASILIHTSEGIQRGLAIEDPGSAAEELAQLGATLGSQRDAIAQALEAESLPTCVFVYRDLTDAELAGYQKFLDTPVGKRYGAASLGAIDKALAEAAENLGRMLAATKST